MRSIAYVVAALAAVGIMVGIMALPVEDTSSRPTDVAAVSEPAEVDETAAKLASLGETETVVLRVPSMHCPFACYPSVKETLEGNESVATVELAEQKVEGVIDNPEVIVTVAKGFDIKTAINALAEKGFSDAEVVH